jgi:RimJ/RimL family protein N-acetyltransferase
MQKSPLTTMHRFVQPAQAGSKPVAVPAVTPIISLKPISVADAPKLLPLMTRDICRKMAIGPVINITDACRFISGKNSTTKDRFAIVHAEYGLIGSVGFELIERRAHERSARLSYWLGEPFHGCGYGTGALTQLLEYLGGLGVNHYTAEVYVYNVASQQLLLKLGFICTSGDEVRTGDGFGVLYFERGM